MNPESSYSLESLERRWSQEKTPQVGLRLAEQYRRAENLPASIEVLAAGLELYPMHTASRVALSRCLVDAARFEEGVALLEEIVVLDPAHLVANKLLVEAYAGVGRIDDARDKLAIYEMMSEGDADIERLHELLEASEREAIAPSAEPKGAAAPGDEPPVAPAIGIPDRDPIEALLDWDAPMDVVEPAPVAASAPAEGDEPFGPISAPGEPADYWQKIADEGIFSFETPEAIEPVEPDQRAVPEAGRDSTATLGKLYLDQGHKEEAVEVFKDVLTREPENQAAQRGLEITTEPSALAAPAAPAPAAGVAPEARVASAVSAVSAGSGVSGAGEEGSSGGGSTPGLVERKKLALTTYLGQIRQATAAGI